MGLSRTAAKISQPSKVVGGRPRFAAATRDNTSPVHFLTVFPSPVFPKEHRPARTAPLRFNSVRWGRKPTLQSNKLVYLLAWLLGVKMNWHPLALLGVAVTVLPGAAVFSTFSLIIACIVKTRERFMGIGQILTMPLFFASNAMYPIAIMPDWLKAVAHVNPLTYEVDAMRALMIQGGTTACGIGADFTVLLLALAVLTMIRARLYPNRAR